MSQNITVNDIICAMDRHFPENMAESWDNPGLLTGHRDAAVRRIFVTLDVSDEALEEAVDWKADLILSHHPLIFGSIRRVTDEDLVGRRLLKLAESGISCYAMHTNYDICRMADLNGTQLGLLEQEVLMQTGEQDGAPVGIGRVGLLQQEMTLEALAEFVKERMELPEVTICGERGTAVRRVAVSGGSGKSVVGDALAKRAQVLITGDIDYHTATDAVSQGLLIIDAGHYGTEYCFIRDVEMMTKELFPACRVRGAAVHHPFCTI